MIDISHNPRLTQLLGRIEETRRALSRIPPHAPERTRHELALAGFYVEVGKYVHWLMRQEPATLERVEAEGRRWAAEADAWLAKRGPEPERKAFESQDIPHRDDTADSASIGGSAADGEQDVVAEWTHDSAAASGDLPELQLADLDGADVGTEGSGRTIASASQVPLDDLVEEGGMTDVTGTPVMRVSLASAGEFEERVGVQGNRDEPEAAWSGALRDLIERLGPPDVRLDDGLACEAEVKRIVAATTNMESHWVGFPIDVQRALLGSISSRARAVQTRRAVDVELRLALGRLRRYLAARGLPPVRPLADQARPEGRDWSSDATAWWKMLNEYVE